MPLRDLVGVGDCAYRAHEAYEAYEYTPMHSYGDNSN
jgi:hypothetical protein